MQLDAFISKTLTEIGNGIRQAQTNAADTGMRINPAGLDKRVTPEQIFWDAKAGLLAQMVEFDLAVTVAESKSAGGNGEISVFGIGGVGGKGEKTSSNTSEQRIKFGVLVILPTTEAPPPPKERVALDKMRNRPSARDIARQ